MSAAALKPTQRAALIALVAHGALQRRPGGYRPRTAGAEYIAHSSRAIYSLVRLGLAAWNVGEREALPTAAGIDLAAALAQDNRSLAA